MATPIRHLRQRFITESLDAASLAVLEIGAFDAPTWMGDAVPPGLRYLDWYSTAELHEMHPERASRGLDRRVEVDYVIKHKHFARYVPERFELVVANHVLEHIADPIAWLREVAALTVVGGHLCLAVPDRRYTFDYIRRESTAVDLVRAHEADLAAPDYWQLLASLYEYRPITAADCWPGPPPPDKVAARRFTLTDAMARAKRAETTYADCHCHVFSERSFPSLLAELSQAGLIPWRLVASRGVLEGGNEFMVLLAKQGAAGA